MTIDPKRPKDREENYLFMIRVSCQTCGHTMLFDSEAMVGGREKILIHELTEEEEDALERGEQ
ncbi:hypothetical protein [Sinomonas sp. P47F7]|uniref:hypothetical protein n=1 Tax=Sinomonas sp. P47F7 TaxID=3410987 RepID=UPI003BF53BCB